MSSTSETTAPKGCYYFHLTAFGGDNDKVSAWVTHNCNKAPNSAVYQIEKCPTTGSLHYQMEIHTNKRWLNSELARDFEAAIGTHPNVGQSNNATLRNKQHGRYASKSETRVAGPFYFPIIEPDPNDFSAGWNMEDSFPKTLYPWQAECVNMVTNTLPDDRTIHWYVDPDGKKGKSTVRKMLEYRNIALGIRWMCYDNFAHLIGKDKPKSKRCYIFDLTKSRPRNVTWDEIYVCIESCKDGLVTSGRYEGTHFSFRPPWVLVFSNTYPKLDKLGKDRIITHDLSISTLTSTATKRRLESWPDSIDSPDRPKVDSRGSPATPTNRPPKRSAHNRESADGSPTTPLSFPLIGMPLHLPAVPTIPMPTSAEHFLLSPPSPSSSDSSTLETQSPHEPWTPPSDRTLGFET